MHVFGEVLFEAPNVSVEALLIFANQLWTVKCGLGEQKYGLTSHSLGLMTRLLVDPGNHLLKISMQLLIRRSVDGAVEGNECDVIG